MRRLPWRMLMTYYGSSIASLLKRYLHFINEPVLFSQHNDIILSDVKIKISKTNYEGNCC